MWRRALPRQPSEWLLLPFMAAPIVGGLFMIGLILPSDNDPLAKLVVISVIAIFLGCAIRAARFGAYVRGSEFKIVNLFRTRTLSLDQIAQFRLEETLVPILGLALPIAIAVVRDGEKVPIWRIGLWKTPPLPSQVVALDESIEGLNMLLSRPTSPG